MAFLRMVDLTRSDEEKAAENLRGMMSPAFSSPDVPHGLCICLTETELTKLGLDSDCEVGDMLHMSAMARVTSISKSGTGCRIELAITDMAVEDESTEATDAGLDD